MPRKDDEVEAVCKVDGIERLSSDIFSYVSEPENRESFKRFSIMTKRDSDKTFRY